MKRVKGDRVRQSEDEAGIVNPRARQRAVCISIEDSSSHSDDVDPLAELKELLRTSGVAVASDLVQPRKNPDPDHYLGKGKIEDLHLLIKSSNANVVACDDELSPRQERNLEDELGVPVLDRTEIILDIFASHASSTEGKLQVELAQLEYNMARMRGLWTHLERLGGGIGTRGPGETQIETDRRLARNKIKKLKRRLEKQKARRRLGRSEREATHIPTVAMAGYTNAGKSTLMNALAGSNMGVAERLFHTLDPTTRSFKIDRRKYLLTDTVGFIRKLPHQLVEAFAATLEDTTVADLILHVVDCSIAEDEIVERISIVEQVLDEIGVGATPQLFVFNKNDLVSSTDTKRVLRIRKGSVAVSAQEHSCIDELKKRISELCGLEWNRVELLIPFDRGDALSELHELAGDLKREDTPEGVKVSATIPTQAAQRYVRFLTDAQKETN